MKYNINELLEKKKELEAQIEETQNDLTSEKLKYVEEKIIDFSNEKNNRDNKPYGEKVTLNEFTQIYEGLISELLKVKTAIQKFNSEKILGKLQEREKLRLKFKYLEKVKINLLTNKQVGRKVLRQDKDGVALEVSDMTIEPMFERDEVQKQMNEIAAQERKVNTEIQKENLNAQIDL